MNRFILSVWTLWVREMVRFYRQPSRVMGALGSPFIFWLLIGSGIGTSFQAGTGDIQVNYLQYFFPGTLILILLFTAIFSTISVIEDRREGFLQSVLVAPIPRVSIVLGKVLGGATLAFSQGFLFLLIAPWIGIRLSPAGWINVSLILFLNAFALTGLGFLIAWQFRSIQGFHAVMNLFLIPLWLLSGALFPEEGALGWMRTLMKLNPLTYGVVGLRRVLFSGVVFDHSPSFATSVGVTVLFGVSLLIASSLSASRASNKDLG